MDGARIHCNSPAPEKFEARTAAQGSDIELAPGQDRQAPHEAWYIVHQTPQCAKKPR
jgi:hypothetical protein